MRSLLLRQPKARNCMGPGLAGVNGGGALKSALIASPFCTHSRPRDVAAGPTPWPALGMAGPPCPSPPALRAGALPRCPLELP